MTDARVVKQIRTLSMEPEKSSEEAAEISMEPSRSRAKGSAKTRLKLNRVDIPQSLLQIRLPDRCPVKISTVQSLGTATMALEQLCAIKTISESMHYVAALASHMP